MAKGGVREGAGRKKGVPNKPKKELLDMIQLTYPGYHPVMAMAIVANDEGADETLRFNANKEVAQYIVPKKRAVEHSGSIDTGSVAEKLSELKQLSIDAEQSTRD